MNILITLDKGYLKIVWPNEEQHVYVVASAKAPHDCAEMVEHEMRDMLADLMTDLLKRGYVRPVAWSGVSFPATYANRLQLAPGDIAVGAGDLQLGRVERTAVDISHVTLLEAPYHKWIVRYSDGSAEDIHDADHARHIAEEIHGRN